MVDDLLAEAQLSLGRLDAIAFGRGPGGFTGVRLAASVAQGLAFGAGLPVLPVSNLLAVAQIVLDAEQAVQQVLVCNDARMGEVYSGLFARGTAGLATPRGVEAVQAPQSVQLPIAPPPGASKPCAVVGAGRGFRAYPQLRAHLASRLVSVQDGLLPSVRGMLPKALTDWSAGLALPATGAQPVYLRDNVARPSVT